MTSNALKQVLRGVPSDFVFNHGFDAYHLPMDLAAATLAGVQAGTATELIEVLATVEAVPTGADLVFDILVDGVSVLTAPAVIAQDTGELTYELAAAAQVPKGGIVQPDITQVGATDAGKGLRLTLIGKAA